MGFLPFSAAPEGCAILHLTLSLSVNGTFHTLLYITLSYQDTYLFPELIEAQSMREAALIPSFVLYQLMNAWTQIYLSAISNNSLLLAGHNLQM